MSTMKMLTHRFSKGVKLNNYLKVGCVAGMLFCMMLFQGCTGKEEPKEYNITEEQQITQGYVFKTDKGEVSIGEDVEEAKKALGDPLTVNEAPSCAFGDLDKIWTYNDFTLYSYQEEGVDYIYDIVITSDAVSTAEGICIGQTSDDVMEAYGQGDEQDDTRIVYKKNDMKLMFIIDSGTVRSIEYASTMLER